MDTVSEYDQILAESSKRLRRARADRGVSVIEACRLARVSRPTLIGYEAGEQFPSLSKLEKLAAVYGVTIRSLLPRGKR